MLYKKYEIFHLLVIKLVLHVEHGEHLLVQHVEEVVERLGQIDLAARVVALQFDEQIAEHVRILFVDDAVGSFEHIVELLFRFGEELHEEVCARAVDVR